MSLKNGTDGMDEIDYGLGSPQLKEEEKEKLLEGIKQMISMALDIVDGFSPPYVRMSSRKCLKRFLEILLKYFEVFKSFKISITNKQMSEARLLLSELSDFFQSSRNGVNRATRLKITHLVESVKQIISNAVANGNELTKVLPHNRIDALSEIISQIMPEKVKYSVEFLPNKTVNVYIGNPDLVESIKRNIAESLKKYNLSNEVKVFPARNGSILTDWSRRIQSVPRIRWAGGATYPVRGWRICSFRNCWYDSFFV
jgi:hypothetical protein